MLPFLIVAAIAAAPQPSSASRMLDQLAECRAITADGERLACFDRVTAAIATARRDGDLILVDRKEVADRKRARFGLGTATTDLGDGAVEVNELDTTVRNAAPSSVYGRFDLALANGTVWQTVDTLPVPPRAGTAIKLRTAPLGGYRASIAGRRAILVKRIR
jgi:hypothetical protein